MNTHGDTNPIFRAQSQLHITRIRVIELIPGAPNHQKIRNPLHRKRLLILS
nr:unknown protein [Arabidopsis thaliana]